MLNEMCTILLKLMKGDYKNGNFKKRSECTEE
jgi:hypothetical protein